MEHLAGASTLTGWAGACSPNRDQACEGTNAGHQGSFKEHRIGEGGCSCNSIRAGGENPGTGEKRFFKNSRVADRADAEKNRESK